MERAWKRTVGWGREALVWLGVVLLILAGAQQADTGPSFGTAGSVAFSSPR